MEFETKILSKGIQEMLYNSDKTVGTAESCTGGRIAEALISVPGASNYFKGGVVSYTNEVKENLLGVSHEVLEEQTAVCEDAITDDDVMGFIDNKNRIEIHKRSCSIAAKLKSSFGNRIVDAKWDMHKQILFDATIEIKGIDRKGMLLDVSKVISDQLGINIHKITISSDNGIFDGTIELRIHDREEVKTIMNQLRNIDDLQEPSSISDFRSICRNISLRSSSSIDSNTLRSGKLP